jgi:dTDP-4-amino-4,6-dideoxygalactose transaminase
VSLCEKAIAEYTGHKYCVALNSCGSALALMLKAAGVQQGDKVLSNAFTFGAVPSAIEHAGGVAVYVESTPGYVMDVEDLENKLKATNSHVSSLQRLYTLSTRALTFEILFLVS